MPMYTLMENQQREKFLIQIWTPTEYFDHEREREKERRELHKRRSTVLK